MGSCGGHLYSHSRGTCQQSLFSPGKYKLSCCLFVCLFVLLPFSTHAQEGTVLCLSVSQSISQSFCHITKRGLEDGSFQKIETSIKMLHWTNDVILMCQNFRFQLFFFSFSFFVSSEKAIVSDYYHTHVSK